MDRDRRAIARILGGLLGGGPAEPKPQRGPVRPLAAFLRQPQGSGKTTAVRRAVDGLEGAGVTTRELAERLGIPEGEQGMATWEGLGKELRGLGWRPRRQKARGVIERRYWPPTGLSAEEHAAAGERLRASGLPDESTPAVD